MTIPWIDRAAIMALVARGLSYRAVARQLRISSSAVGRIAREEGYDPSAAIEQRAESVSAKRGAQKEAKGVCPAVPAWVSAAKLTEDYRDHARDFGEHSAARHCRQLLAEMRRAA